MATNPYATPLSLAHEPSEDREIRLTHAAWDHSMRSIGGIYVLGGCLLAAAALAYAAFVRDLHAIAVVLALGVLSGAFLKVGLGVRNLAPWSRPASHWQPWRW